MFKAQCASRSLHSSLTLYNESEASILHPSKVKNSVKRKLGNLCGVEFKSNVRICSACVCYVENLDGSETEVSKKKTKLDDESDDSGDSHGVPTASADSSQYSHVETNTTPVLVLDFNNLRADLQKLDPKEKSLLAYELGCGEREAIRQDTLQLLGHRSLIDLMECTPKTFIGKSNAVLANFIMGIGSFNRVSQSDIAEQSGKKNEEFRACTAIESVMSLTTPISILPFHFRQLVLIYSLTRSRLAVSVLAGSAPYGSYQTLKSWLNNLASTADPPSLDGDQLAVFDNNQVLQRRWQISLNNTVKSSVITMIVFMRVNCHTAPGNIQWRADLSPNIWKFDETSVNKVKYIDKHPAIASVRYRHLYSAITDLIQQVKLEQQPENGTFRDDIDGKVAEAIRSQEFKTCTNPDCSFQDVPKRARICPRCHEKVSSLHLKQNANHEATRKDKQHDEVRVIISKDDQSSKYNVTYESVGDIKNKETHDAESNKLPSVTVGAPVFVNPCSYESLKTVFREIGKQAGMKSYGGTREWLTIVCDGLPYVLGYRLINKLHKCTACDTEFMGASQCVGHQCASGVDTDNITREFDWIVLQPGPGHIEMNMLKAYVKLTWSVFWEEMVEIFNFKSENAKKSALKVNDHHKGMTLARIAYESLAKELILPFVRVELNRVNGGDFSAANFMKFTMLHVRNPNYAFTCDMVFEILHSIFVYREGVRSGAIEYMEAGRATFCKVWSARNHPMYRQLEMNDTLMFESMPPEVQQHIHTTMSINLSGVPLSGEGADFKLESINKGIQHWLPSVPSDTDWANACANLKPLSDLREAALGDLGMKDPKVRTAKPQSDITKQVVAFRAHIRTKKYLSHPQEESHHTGLNGKPLDEELVNFCQAAREKRAIYYDAFRSNLQDEFPLQSSIKFNESPIFVSPEERSEYEDISNKTISEIVSRIESLIDSIDDQELRADFHEEFQLEYIRKKGKKPLKNDYLNFYYLVEEFGDYETILTADTVPTDDDIPDD